MFFNVIARSLFLMTMAKVPSETRLNKGEKLKGLGFA